MIDSDTVWRNIKTNKDVKIIKIQTHSKIFQVQYQKSGQRSWYTFEDFHRLFIAITE